MKLFTSLLFLTFFLLINTNFYSQSPDLINYQAVARDLSGNPLVSTPVNVTYDIRQGSSTGSIVYSETHNLSTNQFGLFTAEIGGGTPVSGTFAGINWSTGLYYLQVTVNGDVMPATQLLSVPYALHANTATPIKISSTTLSSPGQERTATITATVRLSVGDKLGVAAVINNTGNIDIRPAETNWFSGHIVFEN